MVKKKNVWIDAGAEMPKNNTPVIVLCLALKGDVLTPAVARYHTTADRWNLLDRSLLTAPVLYWQPVPDAPAKPDDEEVTIVVTNPEVEADEEYRASPHIVSLEAGDGQESEISA